jgi:hypothetical protein
VRAKYVLTTAAFFSALHVLEITLLFHSMSPLISVSVAGSCIAQQVLRYVLLKYGSNSIAMS